MRLGSFCSCIWSADANLLCTGEENLSSKSTNKLKEQSAVQARVLVGSWSPAEILQLPSSLHLAIVNLSEVVCVQQQDAGNTSCKCFELLLFFL
jgi:hypothetical protein